MTSCQACSVVRHAAGKGPPTAAVRDIRHDRREIASFGCIAVMRAGVFRVAGWTMLGLALAVVSGQARADEGVSVQGEAAPERAQSVSVPARPHLARLGAMDTAIAVALPAADEEQRAAMEEDPGIGPLRIGFHRVPPTEYLGDLTPRLHWVTDPDDGSVSAAVTVTSPKAVRVRLAIRAELPPGAEIRFFQGSPPTVVGTMSRDDFAELDGAEGESLWSPSVEGDTIGMEVTLPSGDAQYETVVEIQRVSHQYRPLRPTHSLRSRSTSGRASADLECPHVDITCRDVGPNVNAVARIAFETAEGPGACSGTLINNDHEPTFVPYFLTAHHCVSTSSAARSLEAWWFYQAANCGSGDFDRRFKITSGGADLLATSEPQDSTLLRLRSLPPHGALLSGWSAGPFVGADQAVYGIHHPGTRKSYVEGVTGNPMNGRVCDEDQADCFILRNGIPIEVTDGAIEGGSSGSGLFYRGYLVGVLSGRSTCFEAYYGRFSDFYPQVRLWLRREGLGGVAVAPTALRVPEGGSAAYALRLEFAPTAAVTVSLSITGDPDLSARPASVTFTASDWDASRRVTVYAAEDRDRSDGSATITHRVSSPDIAYDGIAVESVGATERDNDRRLLVRVTGVSARAADDGGTLTVRWNAVAGADAYVVEWRQRGQDFAERRRLVVPGGATATTLEDLDRNTIYFVRVTAIAEGVMDGPPSATVSAPTSGTPRSWMRGWRLGVLQVATTTPSVSAP